MNSLANNAALMIIDVQSYFFDKNGGAYLKDSRKILKNIQKLITEFRIHKFPIIFTRHAHRKGSPAGQMGRWWSGKLPREGTKAAKLIPEIKPARNDIIVTKTRYSAFEGTNLAVKLKIRGVRTIVCAGVMTNLCVETTARHAFMKDFQPVIAQDACAANTKKHHRASLCNLSYGFAHILNTDRIVSLISFR